MEIIESRLLPPIDVIKIIGSFADGPTKGALRKACWALRRGIKVDKLRIKGLWAFEYPFADDVTEVEIVFGPQWEAGRAPNLDQFVNLEAVHIAVAGLSTVGDGVFFRAPLISAGGQGAADAALLEKIMGGAPETELAIEWDEDEDLNVSPRIIEAGDRSLELAPGAFSEGPRGWLEGRLVEDEWAADMAQAAFSEMAMNHILFYPLVSFNYPLEVDWDDLRARVVDLRPMVRAVGRTMPGAIVDFMAAVDVHCGGVEKIIMAPLVDEYGRPWLNMTSSFVSGNGKKIEIIED